MMNGSNERGASLVEAALVVPLVLLVLLGMFEIGRFLLLSSTVTNASREAARYAISTGTAPVPNYADCVGVRNAARSLAAIDAPTNGQITIQYDGGPATSVYLTCSGVSVDPLLISNGDRVIVTVSVPFNIQVPGFAQFIGPTSVDATTTRTINKGT